MIDATNTLPAIIIDAHVKMELTKLRNEDQHLHYLNTHAVEISDRPTNAKQRREHGISRVLYTWLRLEHINPEAVAQDIETLAALGRTDRWKTAIRTWAHVARTDPMLFLQYATYTNYQV